MYHPPGAMNRKKNDRAEKMDRPALEKIAEVFRVFSEPTRLAILQALKEGTRSVNELVAETETSQANVSKQLRILYDAGLLIREKKGNQVFYSIKEELVFEMCELVCDKLNRESKSREPYLFSI